MPHSSFDPVSQPTPVHIIPTWPTLSQQLYVWKGVPVGTAAVTYSYQGGTQAWERPLDGTIALVVERPAAFNGNYATWHTAPFPVIRAYNSAGQIIA